VRLSHLSSVFAFPARHCRIIALAAVVSAFWLSLPVGCMNSMSTKVPSGDLRDINAVLADHANELMAIPGVVGVYVGLLDGHRECLRVMLNRKDRELERSIPRALEGYLVVTEVTGPIRPLGP
jgi:hypothetical protein